MTDPVMDASAPSPEAGAETEAGVTDMASGHRPDTYGEQLWNYFARSYPDLMERHYPAAQRGRL